MTDKETLALAIVRNGWYKSGDFTLSSGAKSDYYIDLRPCMLSSARVHLMTICLTQTLMRDVGLVRGDLICGVITSGLFLAGALLQKLGMTAVEPHAIYCRTEHRTHGLIRAIEGGFHPGQSVVLIDDVATSGGSLDRVRKILVDAGLIVKAAVVVVDRNEGGAELLGESGVPLYSVLTVDELKGADFMTDQLWRHAHISGRNFIFRGGDLATAEGQFKTLEEAAAEAERRNDAKIVVVATASAKQGETLLLHCGDGQPVEIRHICFGDDSWLYRSYFGAFRVTVERISDAEAIDHLAAVHELTKVKS